MRFDPFIGGSYQSQSPVMDCAETMNLFLEKAEVPGEKNAAMLVGIPGVEVFGMVAQVGGRGMYTNGDGRVFGVTGTVLYEWFQDGSSTNRGTVALDANPVCFASNGDGGNQLGIAAGGNIYCYDLLTNTLTLELSGNFVQIGMLYGYFVALDVALSRVYVSDLFDGTTWDPTQFFERTIGSDGWIALLVTAYGQIWLLGPQTGEVWYNAGTFPLPFAPHPSGFITKGIAATFSLCEAGDSVVYLSTNKDGGYETLSAKGFRPERISTHAEEYAYSQMNRLDDAIAQTYKSRGHVFYMLKFPTEQQTRVTDFSTDFSWHQRGTWIAEDAVYTAWRPTFHCFGFNKHLMQDANTGYLYEMNEDFTLDVLGPDGVGRVIRRVRTGPSINKENKLISYGRFELYLQSGNGVAGSGQGSNPQVALQMSNDGGRTWGAERLCGSGKLGQYGKRVFWERNGQARDRAFRVIMTDPAPWNLIAAFLDLAVEEEDFAA